MRRIFGVFAFLSLLCGSFPVNANAPGLLGFIQSGNYNFLNLERNETDIYNKYIDLIQVRSEADLTYWKQSIAKLEASFKNFVVNATMCEGVTHAGITHDCLIPMSDKAFSDGVQNPVDIAKFRKAVRRYSELRILFDQEVNNIPSYVSAFPSQIDVDQKIAQTGSIPNYGKVNFDPVVNFYKAQLTAIDQTLSNLPHIIKLKDGNIQVLAENSGQGISFKGFLLSPEEMLKIRKDIFALRHWDWEKKGDYDARVAMDQFTVNLKSFIYAFISNYGTRERWRGKLSPAEQEAREEQAELIAGAFYARSVARARSGMPIGTIGINYRLLPVGLDIITTSNKALSTYIKDPIWNSVDLDTQRKNMQAALNRAVERSGDGIFGGNPGLLAKGASLITWLNGRKELAVSLHMMLQLLAADIQEELIMSKPGASFKMRDWFRKRYLTGATEEETDELKEYYRNLEKEWKNSSGQTKDSLPGSYGFMLISLTFKQEQMAQADQLEENLLLANGFKKYLAENEKDDLFD